MAPAGRVFMLEEREHSIQYQGAKGSNVQVDAAALVGHGIEPLLTEILDALQLTRAEVTAVVNPEAVQAAAHSAAHVSEA